MRKLLQRWFRTPVLRLADKYASRPVKEKVHEALSQLYTRLKEEPGKKGPVIEFDSNASFIIFSDHHKGAKNGADDFAIAEKNYLAALHYYFQHNFHYIALGDVEELWENLFLSVSKHNQPSFEKEKLFLQRKQFTKVYGNHDLMWDNDPLAPLYAHQLFGETLKVYEGVLLKTVVAGKPLEILLTHGHQGDNMSDGNWLSKWFIANVWAPLQAYLGINPNTPAYDDQLKSEHNRLMYEWVAGKENLLLITGHTHQPVFESLTHLERLYKKLWDAKASHDEVEMKRLEAEIARRKREGQTVPDFTAYKHSYFNTGCCCFDDGDITGIEITNGFIRLVKWEYDAAGNSTWILLEEKSLQQLV